MPRVRFVACLALLSIVLVLVLAGCRDEVPEPLPADLVALLPDGAAVLFTVSSLDDLDERWRHLNDPAQGPPLMPEGTDPALDLSTMIAKKVPGFDEVVATDRPMAVTFGVPAMMTNTTEAVLVFAVRADAVVDSLFGGESFVTRARQGDYLALATWEDYVPPAAPSVLAEDRLDGLASLTLDLAAFVEIYRPMVQMGLGMAAMGQAGADSSSSDTMSPAEAAALTEMVNTFMASVSRFDLAAVADATALRYQARIDLVPGSPLVPGPQPDFDEALALTAALPADSHLKMAMAIDQTVQMDIVRDYYLANVRREMSELPAADTEAFFNWFDGYLDMDQHLNVPMALSESLTPDGMLLHAVLRSPDPGGLAAYVAGQLESLGALGVGLTTTPQPDRELAGATVRGWDLAWDDESLEEWLGDEYETTQAEQALDLMEKLTPSFRLVEVDGVVIVTTAPDDATLVTSIEAVRSGGRPDAELADLADAAGPDSRQVMVGDLGMILAWIFDTVLPTDDEDLELLRERPIATTAVVTQDGPRIGMEASIDLEGLRRAVATLRELDKDPDQL